MVCSEEQKRSCIERSTGLFKMHPALPGRRSGPIINLPVFAILFFLFLFFFNSSLQTMCVRCMGCCGIAQQTCGTARAHRAALQQLRHLRTAFTNHLTSSHHTRVGPPFAMCTPSLTKRCLREYSLPCRSRGGRQKHIPLALFCLARMSLARVNERQERIPSASKYGTWDMEGGPETQHTSGALGPLGEPKKRVGEGAIGRAEECTLHDHWPWLGWYHTIMVWPMI